MSIVGDVMYIFFRFACRSYQVLKLGSFFFFVGFVWISFRFFVEVRWRKWCVVFVLKIFIRVVVKFSYGFLGL